MQTLQLSGVHWLSFKVTPGTAVRRARLAIDLIIGGQCFGQQAEALVTVLPHAIYASTNQTSSWYNDASFNWENSTLDPGSLGDTSLPWP